MKDSLENAEVVPVVCLLANRSHYIGRVVGGGAAESHVQRLASPRLVHDRVAGVNRAPLSGVDGGGIGKLNGFSHVVRQQRQAGSPATNAGLVGAQEARNAKLAPSAAANNSPDVAVENWAP